MIVVMGVMVMVMAAYNYVIPASLRHVPPHSAMMDRALIKKTLKQRHV